MNNQPLQPLNQTTVRRATHNENANQIQRPRIRDPNRKPLQLITDNQENILRNNNTTSRRPLTRL